MAERASVPRRRRPHWETRFLEVIRASGNIRLAASAAGVDRTTPYAAAKRDPQFAAAWAAAEQDATDVLEAEARRRALAGSDGLLQFLLRGLRPERYRDRVDVHLGLEREAERVAERLGIPVAVVLDRIERLTREAD